MIFTTETIQEIFPLLERKLNDNHQTTFRVLNPDYARGSYAGSKIDIDGTYYLYRSLRAWMELAELLGCRMLVPKEQGGHLLSLTFEKIAQHSFHFSHNAEKEEKYGVTSEFSAIHKMEEPAFFYYYNQALDNVKLSKRKRILDLGVNRGDEFKVIKNKIDISTYKKMELVGIDHSKTAIEYAEGLFEEENVYFYAEDINNLKSLNLNRFDLLISIGTLQSPGINFKPFFMDLVQNYLEKADSAIILGFPNSRWIGGEMVYGAKAPNYAMSEMSLLFNDVMFCKKYLQQKKYRVTLTGKQYIFLTATKIGAKNNIST
ncbi:class I SAM-dependent methyltransferase [Sulfurovum riftiae]|uniref:Methyltransferase n=1 Tax=Sulfurovum riftiae TaxID=1630136 RepID=A0A151CEN7_9BACT|nr:methyltransferase domain-containing protein [Sulfurovum riftiae]KYJ85713.1 methyltransferase [Sulfurovum riftiae]